MTVSVLISIGIVLLAIVGLVVAGVILKKRISSVMGEFNTVQMDANNTIERFNNDINAINSKVTNIQKRTEAMTQDVTNKQQYLQEFSMITSNFNTSFNELKGAGQGLKNQFVSAPATTTKRTFPSLVTASRTVQKMVKKRRKD